MRKVFLHGRRRLFHLIQYCVKTPISMDYCYMVMKSDAMKDSRGNEK